MSSLFNKAAKTAGSFGGPLGVAAATFGTTALGGGSLGESLVGGATGGLNASMDNLAANSLGSGAMRAPKNIAPLTPLPTLTYQPPQLSLLDTLTQRGR